MVRTLGHCTSRVPVAHAQRARSTNTFAPVCLQTRSTMPPERSFTPMPLPQVPTLDYTGVVVLTMPLVVGHDECSASPLFLALFCLS